MLVPVLPCEWNLAPKEGVALQRELASHVVAEDRYEPLTMVAGVDVGLLGAVARAAVVVLSFPGLDILEKVRVERPVEFPYVPGLLSFREAPVILDALARLSHTPELLIFDGQGYAHPRRMGIATHLGIVLDHPTIGCAKSRLCGTHNEPGPERGSHTWLYDKDEVIGAVVRTRTRVKPLFVSIGHRVRLKSAIDIVLRCGRGVRLPEPTRWAHRVASGTD